MSIKLSNISVKDLKRAIKIKAKLDDLNAELDGILGPSSAKPGVGAVRKKNKMSRAGRAAIANAQRARWAKVKGHSGAKGAKPKRRMSAAGRARIAAAARARWAKVKAAGKTHL